MYKFINDKYRSRRGGHSRVLDVCCGDCNNHVAYYQKDGPGILKRMYLDRFIDIKPTAKELNCASCNRTLGIKINYKKENRPAYRLFTSSTTKKIIGQGQLK